MSYDQRKSALSALSGFAVGQEIKTNILSNRRTGWFMIVLTATVVIAVGGATTILNDGSLSALFTYVAFRENGNPIAYTDARALTRVTELLGAGPASNRRLTTTVAGTYLLRETIILPFANPLGVGPWETCFTEINPALISTIGLVCNPTSMTSGIGLLATSANPVTISLLNANVYQIYDNLDIRRNAPLFRPMWRDLVTPVTQAVVDLPAPIQFSSALRSVLIQGDTNLGTVPDIITAYQLRTDNVIIDGEQGDVNFQDHVQSMPFQFAGAISSERIAAGPGAPYVDPSMLFRNFAASGRLSNVIVNSQIGPNFRLLVTGGPSAVAGVTSNNVRVVMNELVRIQGVTAAKIPFPV